VTFCDPTAPTPARAWAHRAATAGEEDATAIAKRPERAQRAAIENVMRSAAARRTWAGSPR